MAIRKWEIDGVTSSYSSMRDAQGYDGNTKTAPANFCEATCLVNSGSEACTMYAAPCPGNRISSTVYPGDTIFASDLNELVNALQNERRNRMKIGSGITPNVNRGMTIKASHWTDIITDLETSTYQVIGRIFASDDISVSRHYDDRRDAASYKFIHHEYNTHSSGDGGGLSGSAEYHDGWPTGIAPGMPIKAEHHDKIRKLINHLTTDCICNSDCSGYDACACHNNCGCNYG